MSRDYAGRRPYPKERSKSPRRPLMLLFAFVCGYLTAAVFNLESLIIWIRELSASKTSQNDTLASKAMPKPVLKPKPKLEFYTLLSKDYKPQAPISPGDLVPKAPALKPEPKPELKPELKAEVKPANPVNNLVNSPDHKPVNTETYQIQVASLSKRPDAERLKASLVLSGFQVSIVTVAKQGTLWYRVSIGPFHSRLEAEKAQKIVLQAEHMQGILRRV